MCSLVWLIHITLHAQENVISIRLQFTEPLLCFTFSIEKKADSALFKFVLSENKINPVNTQGLPPSH